MSDTITSYFASGYQLLLDQIQMNLASWGGAFNLVMALDLVLLVVLLWWIWSRVRRTAAHRAVPGLIWWLVAILVSRLLGFTALFYISLILAIIYLIAAVMAYSQEVRELVEGSFSGRRITRARPLDQSERLDFIRDLANTVTALAHSKASALLVIKTTKPIRRLVENGTALNTPFNKDFVLDVFSSRSKLSTGALLVDNGSIVAGGSRLTSTNPKSFPLTLKNPALKQVALHWEAVVILVTKDSDTVALLHKDTNYSKLAPSSLERVLKSILIPR